MKRYICEKESMALVSCDFDDTKINGFKVKPKNNIEYEGIEEIGRASCRERVSIRV